MVKIGPFDAIGMRFGKDNHLKIVGFSHCQKGKNMYYVKCFTCENDYELFGPAIFKMSFTNLKKGLIPCGCSNHPKWTKDQLEIRVKREAIKRGFTFMHVEGDYNKTRARTYVKLYCPYHGSFSKDANAFFNGKDCQACGAISKSELISERFTLDEKFHTDKFYSTKRFPDNTKFERITSKKWKVYCPSCNTSNLSLTRSLVNGVLPCNCNNSRSDKAYINILYDNENAVAIKFGISKNPENRRFVNCKLTAKLMGYWEFANPASCSAAETFCIRNLPCGYISKTDMPDGYSETAPINYIENIIKIYESFGGIKVEV